MQVSNPNNVKIYNLSAGKSLPEWLTDRKKRTVQKQDVDIERRIELIQHFEMPTVSHCVQVSPDGQYIFVSGTYKPRVRCFEVSEMSMKFERCLDSDVVKFHFLGDDWTKLAFLLNDRYIEFHSQFGRYYRTRIPKYGRDMAYHSASCDMYAVGVGPEIFRINLEQGRFLNPIVTKAQELNCCEFNELHQMFACGTSEGHVECYDPRVRTRVGILDTALSSHIQDLDVKGVPAVTAMKFRGGLQMGVGTSTGHVLLYDIRSDKPLLVKDHQYELPIRKIAFHEAMDLVLSIDTKILKLWDRETGKAYTAVEPGTNLNDLCVVPDSGLIFMANEAPKVLTYYLPTLGTAPKWCSFLDNLTEELEESNAASVYDDYKFVTRKELEDLGLANLIGSNLLRAYMHGFFLDIRLYHKAKSIAEPFAYDHYRKSKIREKIEKERANRVRINKLPKVNRELAEKLLDVKESIVERKTAKAAGMTLLKDSRFSDMFDNPDFQIDKDSEEYKLLNPVVNKLDKAKKRQQELASQFREVGQEGDDKGSDSSSDDEHTWGRDEKLQRRQDLAQQKLAKRAERHEKRVQAVAAAAAASVEGAGAQPKFFELKDDEEYGKITEKKQNMKKMSLADRLQAVADTTMVDESGSVGNKQVKFVMAKSYKAKKRESDLQEHHAERRKVRRSAGDITRGFKDKPKFWMGKRVK